MCVNSMGYSMLVYFCLDSSYLMVPSERSDVTEDEVCPNTKPGIQPSAAGQCSLAAL